MADEPTKDAPDPGEGKVLPKREMMSLVSTDPVPVDPVYSTMVPVSQEEGPPLGRLPVEPITEGGTDDPDSSQTFQETESSSAG